MPAFSRPLLIMMEHAYLIRNWPDHFETYESKKIRGPLSWVATPTKHDGRSYKRVTQGKSPVEIMCAWWSLLQVAAKMPVHGLLADRDGPLDAEDLAMKTDLPPRIYRLALPALVGDKIGWLEMVPWDKNLDFAGNIANLIDSQRLPADSLYSQRTTARTSRPPHKKKGDGSPGNASAPQQNPADTSSPAGETADSSLSAEESESALLQTVQDSTDITDRAPCYPPAGDQAEQSAPLGLLDARQQICKKILGGKNPGGLWSPEAEDRLARAVEAGLPAWEIDVIAWFRGLPENDEIPELKARRFPITETTLMNYWGDELTRALAYWKKVNGKNGAAKKRGEPRRWREFFRAKYPEADTLHLPSSFYEMPEPDRKAWEREHEDWERENPELPL